MQKVRVKRKGRERFKGCLLLASGASGDSLKCPPGLTSAASASPALASPASTALASAACCR